MVTASRALALLVLVACSQPTARSMSALSSDAGVAVLSTDLPTEQDVDVSTVGAHGEINMVSVHGIQSGDICYPGDIFAGAVRVNVDDQCGGDHWQRVGGLAVETKVTGGVAHERHVVGVEASAEGGTINTAILALSGDIAANSGDIYTNSGNMYASGFVAGSDLYSWSGKVNIHHAAGWLSVMAYAAAPTDYQPRGTLAIDMATPALWLSCYDAAVGLTCWQRVGAP